MTGLLRDGIISEEVYSQLDSEVDFALMEKDLTWPELLQTPQSAQSIKALMVAVIQHVDVENAISALNMAGFSTSHLQSSGGFLHRRNVTLLIGMPEGREETAVRVLSSSCRERVEYASSFWRDLPVLSPAQVTIGGASIFILEVESCEEF